MGDSEQYQAAATAEEDGPSSAPWVMGVLVVVGLVVVVVVAGHYSAGSGRSVPANPYISKVEVAGLHMATAENFAGGTVTYIEGRMANHGDKRITGARIEILFKDTLGQIAQKDALPVMVVQPNIPYLDYGPLDLAPLAPGQARDFRLTIEHITIEWDGQLPQARVVSVNTGG
ncbi:MAG TPA: hypothetical protein VNW97_07910 [Candidatus Saccharimonadales bacterium]|jgi:hypothetical protein|nr:hypothetical protein [Candidatus Saccharimonadales bacterium]